MTARPRRAATGGFLGFLALVVALGGAGLLVLATLASQRPQGQPRGTQLAGAAAGATPSSGATAPATSGGSPAAGGAIGAPTQVPIVPVVRFWSPELSISREELVAALRGKSSRYRQAIVSRDDREQIATALGTQIAASVASGSARQIRAAVRSGALGLMRASDVTPAVRALGIGGKQLFGVTHVASLAAWPLVLGVPSVKATDVDPANTWTIAAAGDILLDRGIARQVKVLGKGVNFPYDGGNATITGYTCCSGYGHRVPTWRRTGERGAVRGLLQGADLAMANLESPVDNEFSYHTSGTTFSGDPKLLDGLKNAGLDFVSMANNHVRDAGSDGILETVAELNRRGIGHSGAGKNIQAARQPAILEARGIKVAVIGCDSIAASYWTAGSRVGSRSCRDQMAADIKAAKRRADIVIVYPHWGVEYHAAPTALQRSWAAQWIAAGADIIVGNHVHWAAAMEDVKGKLVFYGLGNFVFDQMWSEQTMEGLVAELTFQGKQLKQAWLRPTLLIDQSQPNFLDPGAADGARVLRQVRDASRGLLPY